MIEIIRFWTAVVDESEEWSSQLIFQFKQLERRSLKKSGLPRDSNLWPMRYRCDALTTELRSHALGARSIYWVQGCFPFDQNNIPVWNSGYSIRQMEQYFPVRWINPSQVIRFQVSFENTKSNRGLFYLSLLALGLLNDSEVEINDILGESDNITFIVRI